MIILLLAACLPDTFTETGLTVFDRERRCYYRDVDVTFDMTYWKEWYAHGRGGCVGAPEDNDGGSGEGGYFPTADGLCIGYVACHDNPPLVSDDPQWDLGGDAIYDCSTFNDEGAPAYADCDAPILTAWP